MADTLGLGAGRQSRAHLQLSRALWFRQRGKSYRFYFDPGLDPGLTIETSGQADGTGSGLTGTMFVADDDGVVFCTASPPAEVLPALAKWAKQKLDLIPALAILADAGAAQTACEPGSAIDPGTVTVLYDSTLWDDLLVPDEATVAAALAATPPGERMWFWMTADPGDYALPLIVQPLAWDPNHDRTAWLIDRNIELGAGDGATGTCAIADDGSIQFLGDELHPSMLTAVAGWVQAYQDDFPALSRLVHCRLLLTGDGVVEEVFTAPELWRGVPAEPLPGTLATTAAVLGTLAEGGECWFWITGGSGAPFLHLAATAADLEGEMFRAQLPLLYARFPQSFADAITGIMTKRAGDRFVFVSADSTPAAFTARLQALLGAYAGRFPVLQALAGSVLVPSSSGARQDAVPAAT